MDWITWFWEIARAVGWFFANPLTYVIIGTALWIGSKRVKQERKDFKTRLYPPLYDVLVSIWPGIAYGLLVSILIVVSGLFVPLEVLAAAAVLWILFIVCGLMRFATPAHVLGLSVIAAHVVPIIWNPSGGFWGDVMSSLQAADLRPAFVLTALLVLTEGLLLLRTKRHHTSPYLFKTPRGKWQGAHRLKRVWLLPAFILVPGDALQAIGWWPLFPIEGTGLSLLLFPFAAALRLDIIGNVPQQAVRRIGGKIVLWGIILGAAAGAAYLVDYPIYIAAAAALLGREWITWSQKRREASSRPIYTVPDRGLRVAGILPYSPAEKMDIKPGEIITRVNGQTVTNESDLYQAIQLNSAYSKIGVIDLNQELRYTQIAVYANEHYLLGLLLVKQE